MERLLTVARAQGGLPFEDAKPDAYIAGLGEAGLTKSMELAFALRDRGFAAEFDTMGRSLKAQMKYADKLGARFVAIVGGEEIAKGAASVKDMSDGSQHEVGFEGLADFIAGAKGL